MIYLVNTEWKELYKKTYNGEDKNDFYSLYQSACNDNHYRLRMLGVWIQVNIYYKVENNEIKVLHCTHQAAEDEEYIPHEISEEDAMEYCEDFEDFIESYYK